MEQPLLVRELYKACLERDADPRRDDWSTWPSSASWVIGTLIGISMLFSGITRLILSFAVRPIVA